MPEFILNVENATAANWYGLDDFTKGFIEAAFFSETSCYDSSEFFTDEAQSRISEGQADGNIPNDAGPDDIDAESLASVQALCAEFQQRNAALLSEAYQREYDDMQAGRDFYFTRAGHGVGYWDRDALKANADDAAEYERLTALMVANRDNKEVWSKALAARKTVESRGLGERLSKACGRAEINLHAYESDKSESGFFIGFECI